MSISPSKERILISLEKSTIKVLDDARGKLTRSEFIDTAIFTLVSMLLIQEQEKRNHKDRIKQEGEKNA